MDAFLTVLGGVAGLGVSVWAGLALGRWSRDRRGWVYWVLNLAVLVVGGTICTVGLVVQQTWVWTAGLAFMAGGLTGLKYGLGRSVGVWRALDTVTGTRSPDAAPRRDE